MCRYLHEKSGNFSGDQYEFVPHQPNREILELRSPIKDRRPPPPPPQYLSDFEEEMPEAEPQSLISKVSERFQSTCPEVYLGSECNLSRSFVAVFHAHLRQSAERFFYRF